MTKELVDEARVRPMEEQAVIDEAKKLFDEITNNKLNIKSFGERTEEIKEQLAISEKKLKKLEAEEYTIEPSSYKKGEFVIKYCEVK